MRHQVYAAQVSSLWTGYGANSIVASVANVMRHVFHCTSALLQAFDASQESAMAILFMLTVAMTVLELCCGMRTETLW